MVSQRANRHYGRPRWCAGGRDRRSEQRGEERREERREERERERKRQIVARDGGDQRSDNETLVRVYAYENRRRPFRLSTVSRRWKKTRLMSRESATINMIIIVERKLRDGGSESARGNKTRDIKFAIWRTLHMHDTCVRASLNDHFASTLIVK
ncbi:hypothetical protein DBV15_00241 [Temnothorax longispinosus]|uniref:Uncharacterized protein n=1 Tax=Temnothorax longispinosus TaxID=300112 RepID=A0A4S2KDR6_9HYME|nr:hypothetical protein DBV15_00241 [Temnothorax longispinosus]